MRLGIITDTHLNPAGTAPGRWHNDYLFDRAEELLQRAVAFFDDRAVDAIAVLGDLTNFGDTASIAAGVRALERGATPVIIVAGNHDAMVSVAEWRATIESGAVGRLALPDPARTGQFSLRVAGIGEIIAAADGQYHVPPQAITAPPDEPLLVLTHFPLLDREAEVNAAGFKYAGGFHWGTTGDALPARTAPTIVLHGHLHIRQTTVEDQILQIGFAAMIEPPHEVGLVEITAKGETITLHIQHHGIEPHAVEAAHLPVFAPDRATWTFVDGAWTSA